MAAHGSKAAPTLPDRRVRLIAAGAAKRPVSAEKFRPVAGYAATPVIHIKERGPVEELGIVGIAGEERAALRLDGGNDMHGRFRPQVAKHPFHIAGGREFARPARLVAHFQHRKLDRRIECHVQPQFGVDAALRAFEDGVAEAMPGDVGRSPTAGRRRRRPEVAALFIAEIKGLAARIAHRIVGPGREPELMGVLAPGSRPDRSRR